MGIRGSLGTRDRSWGIRPVGAPDSQPSAQGFSQFYWLWTPINFEKHAVFFHTNDDGNGRPWNRRAVIDRLGVSRTEYEHPRISMSYRPGTRRLTEVKASFEGGAGLNLTIRPAGRNFYMSGLGYTHPDWGHGRDHGVLEVACDTIDLAAVDDSAPAQIHIQALATAVLEEGGQRHEGRGVLEQLLLGPHAPSGLTGALDGAR